MAAFMNDTGHGLIHPSDRGTLCVFLAHFERLAELGVKGSVGSVGDSYGNALAESVSAACKTELIKARKPWRTVEGVEFATLERARWS